MYLPTKCKLLIRDSMADKYEEFITNQMFATGIYYLSSLYENDVIHFSNSVLTNDYL